MKRSRYLVRTGFACAIGILCGAALFGGVNQWTSQGPGAPIFRLAVDPSDRGTVYAAGYVGDLFKSSDGGRSWQKLDIHDVLVTSPNPFIPSSVSCLSTDPKRPASVYAGTYAGQFLGSRDGGTTWESSILEGARPSSIAVDGGTGAIYLGSENYVDRASAPVRKSTDGGATWSSTGLSGPRGTYSLLADSIEQTLLAGTDWGYQDYGFSYIYPYGGAVARSSDGGTSWAFSDTDLGSSVTALAREADGSFLYAGTAAGALYRSVDGGVRWSLSSNISSAPVRALVADPVAAGVLYAATDGGVLRSADRGVSWTSFNAGMGPRNVTSLAIDPSGTSLHAATSEGVFDNEIRGPTPTAPCAPGSDHLCLLGSRFRVDLAALAPNTGAGIRALAGAGDEQAGYFSFPELTGDPTLPEVLVKMVDATSLPGGDFWIFYGSLTSASYTLTVTDTTTGLVREYDGVSLCGGTDASNFVPSSAWDYPRAASRRAAPAAPRNASAADLFLLSGRFRITLSARNPASDTAAAGWAIGMGDRFGAFSLPAFTGDPRLPEVFVKMIDATGGAFLLFHTGLTGLPYTLTVVDTVSGAQQTFVHDPAGSPRLCGGAELLLFSP